jgi:hypothetical protein
MDKQALAQFVQDNPKLVSMKPAKEDIFVLKYKKRVFFDNLWNDFLEECRGTIVDKNFNVISRPFTKIYNYGIELRAPKIDSKQIVTAYRKINGFMVAMTWYQDDILVSTTGSIDSEYVDMAREMMLTHQSWSGWQEHIRAAEGYTLMFECVHPRDPHIVPEKSGMYFLGQRENSWNSVVDGYAELIQWQDLAVKLGCYKPTAFQATLGEVQVMTKSAQHEGFVIYTQDGLATKIKTPYYLVNKFVARNPRTDKIMNDNIWQLVDEEFYPLIYKIRQNIETYTALSEQERLAWVRDYFGS